jgi:hypothetical protein
VRVEEFILPAAVVEVAVVDLAVLIDVIVQRQIRLAEGLSVNHNIVRFEPHVQVPPYRRAL